MPVNEDLVVRTLLSHRLGLLAYIEALVRDAHIAEDVFQDVSSLALQKRDTIDDAAHLLKWLRKTARFRASYAMRQRFNQPLVFDDALLDEMDTQWIAHVESTSGGGDETDRIDALRVCMEALTPNARQLIDLRYREGISGQDLADATGKQLNTVYVALTRIHRTLADCIRKRLAEGGDE